MRPFLETRYRWHRHLGRWAERLSPRHRFLLRGALLGSIGAVVRAYVRARLVGSLGWRGAWSASRQQLALASVALAMPSQAGRDPEATALHGWSAYARTLFLQCPYRSGLPWPTTVEATLWPQLDCKGRAILLARDAYERGLAVRVCVGIKPGSTSAHAWAEVRHDGVWWAGDGLSEEVVPSSRYLEGSGLEVLHRHDIPVGQERRASPLS